MTYVLSINNLNIHYQDKTTYAVRNINLQVKQSSITCLVGESGSGKTSVALALLRRLPPCSYVTGDAIFNHTNLFQCSEGAMKKLRGSDIYYISQSPMNAFNPSVKMGKQLYELVGKKLGINKNDFNQQMEALLLRLHFQQPEIILKQYPFQLSGGMLQRLNIAAAFLLKPSLIIADEPTSSLDVDVQKEILKLMIEVKNELGITFLLITHDFGVVAEIADEVIVMKNGQIIEQNDVFSIFNEPQKEYTRELLDAVF